MIIVLRKVGPYFTALQESTDKLNLVVQENLTGIRVVKSFVREDHEREKFADRNRGEITVDTQVGQGTTFTVTFPANGT